ncbi:hypothetical protein ACFW0P_00455 [Lysobacter soli]
MSFDEAAPPFKESYACAAQSNHARPAAAGVDARRAEFAHARAASS